MTTRTSSRICKTPIRFEDECFKPGANNKHTVGRDVDAGHSAKLESDDRKVGDFMEVDGDFVVGDEEVEYDEGGGGSESESEGDESESEGDADDESESEGDESEAEVEEMAPPDVTTPASGMSEEDWLDTTDMLYWGEIMSFPAIVRWFSLKNGIWSRCCYAKKIGEDRWLVAPLDWLEECPSKMIDEQEWLDNSIGVLTNTELRVNEYIVGDFEEAFGRKAEPSRWPAMPDDE